MKDYQKWPLRACISVSRQYAYAIPYKNILQKWPLRACISVSGQYAYASSYMNVLQKWPGRDFINCICEAVGEDDSD